MLVHICFREVLKILQVPEYPLSCIIIVQRQSNGQGEACMKFVLCILKKVFDANNDVCVGFVAYTVHTNCSRITQPSLVDVQQNNNRHNSKTKQTPIIFNHDDYLYDALIEKKQNANKNQDAHRNYPFMSTGSTVVMQREDGSA